MDCITLTNYRASLYACFDAAGDTLLNIVDALATETAAQSLPELSLSAFFPRKWSSLYQGLQHARIDRAALRRVFAAHASRPMEGKRLVLGIDASSILRPCSQTAADRTYVHASNLPEGSQPVAPGWQFSTLTVLPETPSSWTYVLDNLRIASQQTQATTASAQLTAVLPLLAERPLLLGDGYYGSVTFLRQVDTLPCDCLLRLAKNRVLFRPAPQPPVKRGRGALKKDGAAFACHRPDTHGTPDASWQGTDADGHPLEVTVWHRLHWKAARTLEVSVLRVERPHAQNTERNPRVSWFVFRGGNLPPLPEIVPLYRRRYSQEHGYRVDKQNLLWEKPRLRTPEQFQVGTDLVAATRNLLCLARPTAQAVRQPWESKTREFTPQQCRRAMGRILTQLGTPARLPQLRGKSSGRATGTRPARCPRYKTVYKAKNKPNKNV